MTIAFGWWLPLAATTASLAWLVWLVIWGSRTPFSRPGFWYRLACEGVWPPLTFSLIAWLIWAVLT